MNKEWIKIFNNLQKHLSECSYGTVGLIFEMHSGGIAKVQIQHVDKYMDVSEVPDVSITK